MDAYEITQSLFKLDTDVFEYISGTAIENKGKNIQSIENKGKNIQVIKDKKECKPPQFIKKLNHILSQKEECGIRWTTDGNSIEIYNKETFKEKVLEKYFKHTNISSFIRQLNLHQFGKINQINPNNKKLLVFKNPFFSKTTQDCFYLIQKKNTLKKNKEKDKKNEEIISLANQINEKLNNVSKELCSLRKERAFFYKEIIKIKKRTQKQESLIKNLFLFLKSFINEKTMFQKVNLT